MIKWKGFNNYLTFNLAVPQLLQLQLTNSTASNYSNNNDDVVNNYRSPTPPVGLSLMPSSALLELLHRVEAAIREYSEELIGQLARREELEFEKEVKNTFITALMEVQNKQKEQRDSSKRRRRDKALSLQGGAVDTMTGEKTGSMPAKVSTDCVCVCVGECELAVCRCSLWILF